MSENKRPQKTVGDTEWFQSFERNMELFERKSRVVPINPDPSISLLVIIERLEKIEKQQEVILDILRRLDAR